MSTDDGGPAEPGSGGGRPAYNRPRRYAVQAPAAEPAAAPADEVTRQHPVFDDTTQRYGRRHDDLPAPPPGPPITAAPEPSPPYPDPYATDPYPTDPYPTDPYPAERGAAGHPPAAAAQPAVSPPGRSNTPSTRVLLIAAAVVVVLAVVIGIVVGSSGGDSPTAGGTHTPSTSAPTASAPTSSAPAATIAPSTAAGGPPVQPVPATALCANLGDTTPFSTYVARPRPAERMPESYVEPQFGRRVAVCVGVFRPGAGAGRGQRAYLAEYERLPATQYVAKLKTLGWVLVSTLPRVTYRNPLRTTVTLVQRGTSLVTVVGDGT